MKNPFEYGSIVEDAAFCNRQSEVAELRRCIENDQRVLLFAERRMGKTSLVKRVLGGLPQKTHLTAYVDLWPTDSERSFSAATAGALTEASSGSAQKMLEFARQFFGSLAPAIGLDSEGKPQVTFGTTPRRDVEHTLRQVLAAPAAIAAKSGKKVVVVLDEFQQVFEYENDIVERELRSAMQQQKGVAYLLLGSRKHVIEKMILDRARPLYRVGQHFPLLSIKPEHWLSFVDEKFSRSGKRISEQQIRKICDLTQGHPFYTQHLCHALWELTELAVSDEQIDEAMDVLLEREDYAYTALCDAMPISQRRLLEGLAFEPPGAKIFSAEFLERYELKSAATVQRAIKGLLERDIVDKEQDQYFIADRFFKIWLQRKHSS